MQSSYRPHTPGYDYYDAGIYHITVVTRNREPLFGSLNMDAKQPAVILNEVGQAVMECWYRIPAHHAAKGRKIGLLAACCKRCRYLKIGNLRRRALMLAVWVLLF